MQIKSGTAYKAEAVSNFLSNLSSPSQTLLLSNSKLQNSDEMAMVLLASFP